MEHLNRRLKSLLRNMGSNVTNSSVALGAKYIGIVDHVCQLVEKQTGLAKTSDHYSSPSFCNDFNMVLNVLVEQEIFIMNRQLDITQILSFRVV